MPTCVHACSQAYGLRKRAATDVRHSHWTGKGSEGGDMVMRVGISRLGELVRVVATCLSCPVFTYGCSVDTGTGTVS
jgi:hypothetical protein